MWNAELKNSGIRNLHSAIRIQNMSRLRESQKHSQKLMSIMTHLAERYSISQEDLVRLSDRAAYFCHWNAMGHAEGESDRSVQDFIALLRELRQRFGMKPDDALEFARAAMDFSVENAWQAFLTGSGQT